MTGCLSHMGQVINARVFHAENLKDKTTLDTLLLVGGLYYSEL
jgi:hypothetical protein